MLQWQEIGWHKIASNSKDSNLTGNRCADHETLGFRVIAAGYDALGVPRPGVGKKRIGPFEAKLDQIIANAQGTPNDAELEAAVAAAESMWAKPRTRAHSKQAEVVRMLQRPEGATVRQICDAIGWQAHTVRGAFAGAFKKKLGLTLVSDNLDALREWLRASRPDSQSWG